MITAYGYGPVRGWSEQCRTTRRRHGQWFTTHPAVPDPGREGRPLTAGVDHTQ